MDRRQRSEKAITNGDDGNCGRSSSNINDDDVPVDARQLRNSRVIPNQQCRMVRGESRCRLSNSLENVDPSFFGCLLERRDLGFVEGGRDRHDGSGDWATEEVLGVREEDFQVANGDLVGGESRGLFVDENGEGGGSGGIDNRGGVVGLLERFHLLVAVADTGRVSDARDERDGERKKKKKKKVKRTSFQGGFGNPRWYFERFERAELEQEPQSTDIATFCQLRS